MNTPTILLVDDEPGVLRALGRTFKGQPYHVRFAASGKEALAILATTDVALVMSDVDMPEMSGVDLMRRIRAEYPSVARLMFTGGRDFSAAVHAINDGAISKFLLKPWDNVEMRDVVADALERRGVPVEVDSEETLRREAVAELRRRYPGIASFPRGRDPYVIDERRIEALAARLDDPTLVGLLIGGPA